MNEVCKECGNEKIHARGLCRKCYMKIYERNKRLERVGKNNSQKEKLNRALVAATLQSNIIMMATQGNSYESIGNKYNISRQRVEQIILRLYRLADQYYANGTYSYKSLINEMQFEQPKVKLE